MKLSRAYLTILLGSISACAGLVDEIHKPSGFDASVDPHDGSLVDSSAAGHAGSAGASGSSQDASSDVSEDVKQDVSIPDSSDGSAGAAGTAGYGGGAAGTAGSAGQGGAAGSGGTAGFAGQGGAAGSGGSAGSGGHQTEDTLTYGPEGASCAGGLTCQGISCCQNTLINENVVEMGRTVEGADQFPAGNPDEQPEHVESGDWFYLDVFEVTVGRFRKFYDQFDGTPPKDGEGAHPSIPKSGWRAEWNEKVPTKEKLAELLVQCEFPDEIRTWTPSPASNENRPINCLVWHIAFAFCVWDGGRLPTEAEWERAAAGAEDNRLFPWGHDQPTAKHANYFAPPYHYEIDEVGSYPLGRARWGQYDLAGNVREWVFDYYLDYWYKIQSSPCLNCANTDKPYGDYWPRSDRGGDFRNGAALLRAASRFANASTRGYDFNGFRCAKNWTPKP